nr:lipoate--protein ligase [Clostridioides sp.]
MHKIYISNSYNPYFNLAFEEYLVKNHSQQDEILFLWQNQNTVVIGRNQNPWKECNIKELNLQEGKLVRRLSGGGAVFHDKGNLNFTFISAFYEGKLKENTNIIIEALASKEIKAEFSGKNDILVDGNKISGNAFFVENDILCHHGTLLVDVDIEKLGCILTVSENKLKSKGIESVKSRVININKLNRDISTESLKTDLINTFSALGNKASVFMVDEKVIEDDHIRLADIYKLMDTYESWEWNFGSSPEFNYQISKRFTWGGVDIDLLVKDGIIVEANVYTDALDVDLPQSIKNIILNTKFDNEKTVDLISKELKI